ncbi:MAG: recombination mediator RecR [Bacteroidota bacterium]|nr:recombination protein RecR [Bacteroidota bacterium]MCA6445228.1 recombination protein RecR [Bacteroidota bacterium]
MELGNKIIEQAVEALSKLPGVGKKTALRYVLHIVKNDLQSVVQLSQSIAQLKTELKFCKNCHNISEKEICDICSNPLREKSIVCVVQDYRDVLAIENTGLYKGNYHVLGGLISPMDGIGPSQLNIDNLINRVSSGGINEIILALNTTMEGETTSFFVFKKLAPYNINLSAIARGIAVGDELEYTDEITLGRSITNRVPFESLLKK